MIRSHQQGTSVPRSENSQNSATKSSCQAQWSVRKSREWLQSPCRVLSLVGTAFQEWSTSVLCFQSHYFCRVIFMRLSVSIKSAKYVVAVMVVGIVWPEQDIEKGHRHRLKTWKGFVCKTFIHITASRAMNEEGIITGIYGTSWQGFGNKFSSEPLPFQFQADGSGQVQCAARSLQGLIFSLLHLWRSGKEILNIDRATRPANLQTVTGLCYLCLKCGCAVHIRIKCISDHCTLIVEYFNYSPTILLWDEWNGVCSEKSSGSRFGVTVNRKHAGWEFEEIYSLSLSWQYSVLLHSIFRICLHINV